MFESLFNWVNFLEEAGELIRVKENLSPCYEVAAALRYIERKLGKAVLLEKIDGYSNTQILGNLLSNRKRLALLLGVAEDRLEDTYLSRTATPIAPNVIEDNLSIVGMQQAKTDVFTMPVLTHHERDVSPYLTSAVIFAKDPVTGARGMGIHRIQVKDKDRLGAFLNSPPLCDFLAKAEELGQDLEVAIVIGMNPLTWLASVAHAPEGVDKLSLAGSLLGKAVDLARCGTVDIEVPIEAEYVLEGRVLAGVREREGPFGESNGVYCTYDNPVIQVQRVSVRTNPIYHALVPFNHEENVLIGMSWEMQYLGGLQQRFPFLKRMHLEEEDWTKAIFQVDREKASVPMLDFASQVLQELFFIKTLIIVDTDIDVYDSQEVSFALATRFQPDRDMLVLSSLPALALDPSAAAVNSGFYTAKVAMDATVPPAERGRYEKIKIPEDAVRNVIKKLASI